MLETRERRYPRRKEAHPYRKGGQKKRRDDPGGLGREIVREALVCVSCAAGSQKPQGLNRI
ncbi:MAG: hypothetical protein AAGM22_07105 [Acidobacteriota bacterium]